MTEYSEYLKKEKALSEGKEREMSDITFKKALKGTILSLRFLYFLVLCGLFAFALTGHRFVSWGILALGSYVQIILLLFIGILSVIPLCVIFISWKEPFESEISGRYHEAFVLLRKDLRAFMAEKVKATEYFIKDDYMKDTFKYNENGLCDYVYANWQEYNQKSHVLRTKQAEVKYENGSLRIILIKDDEVRAIIQPA